MSSELFALEPGTHGQVDGPFDVGFFCVLPPARSKSNDRALDRSRQARRARARQTQFDVMACNQLKCARPRQWVYPDESVRRVADRPQVLALIACSSTLDVGNLSKSILDVGERARLYRTDASVRADLSVGPDRASDPTVTVTAWAQLPADAGARQQAEASRALLDWWIAHLS